MFCIPLSTEIIPTDQEEVAFKDLDVAILVGSMPRRDGMERKDLLKANVKIFQSQGTALEKFAKKTVKVTTNTFVIYHQWQSLQEALFTFEYLHKIIKRIFFSFFNY